MKHALLVAFHYPPEASSSGVLRTLKYTRYLGRFAWRLTVLTVNREAYEIRDPGLERQIPAEVRVIRTPFVNTKWRFSIRGVYPSILAVPDAWIGWWPWAVAAGRRLMKRERIDLIYSTSPHATAHLVAFALARGTGVPWVADFRDPWYEDPPEPGVSRISNGAARWLERCVIRAADRVIGTTTRLRDTLAMRYPEEPGEKFVAIPNGYDEADFTNVSLPAEASRDDLLIVHAGSINPYFRDPRPVFAAVREAADQGLLDPGKVRFRFLGAGPFGESPEMVGALRAAGLTEQVEFRPRVAYDVALGELMKADVLLLLQASADTVDLVPAKLFEYLRAGRPVLAVVSSGSSGEVLEEVGGGWIADPAVPGALRGAVAAAYATWADKRLHEMTARPEALRRFSRERLAGELARQFESLLEGAGG